MSHPILTFIVPVKSELVSTSWGRFSMLFERTLRSITNQTSNSFQVVIVCHELPAIEFVHPSINYITVDFAPPKLLKGDQERNWDLKEEDKAKKIQVGLKYLEENPSQYVMVTDADDCVSSRIVETIEKFNSKEVNGWYFKKGYLYKEGTNTLILNIGNFSRICGSSIIIKPQLIKHFLVHDRALIYKHYYDKPFDLLGLIPFPIIGAIYSMDNGENHYMTLSTLKQRVSGRSKNSIKKVKGLIRKIRDNRLVVLSKKIRREFGLNPLV